jgi:CubicO group peptidase (beta-lactamase class C family)
MRLRIRSKVVAILFTVVALCTRHSAAAEPTAVKAFENANAAGADALYVIQDGKVLLDWTREERRPIEMMSAVKSVVAFAVGRLLLDGKISSLDEPVHRFYPEWNQGRKKLITVRHLMNHTSGIQNVQNAGAEIYPAPDAVRLALAAELEAAPGDEFAYNNKAVNLLAGIIEKASGLRMDLYIAEKLFTPLKINQYQWYFDRSGTPHAMAGLRLLASDAAKFGQLLLDRGMTSSGPLASEQFVSNITAAGQAMYPLSGLLWWRHAASQSITLRADARLSDPAVTAIEALRGTTWVSRSDVRAALQNALGKTYEAELRRIFGPDWFNSIFEWKIGEIEAYYAEGFLGKFIVVVPAAKLIAVRQTAQKADPASFSDFPARVVALAKLLQTR